MLTKSDIEKYFIAEKQESLLFLIFGIAAIIVAIVLLFIVKNNFARGAAIPLLLIGILQVVVGYTVYNRSDADRTKVVYAYDMNPQELKNKELVRMEKVNKNFVIYRWIEIILAVIGIILIIKFNNNLVYQSIWSGNAFWFGLGLFLTIQSLLMLGADYFAEKRALFYTKGLQEFVKKNRL